MFNHKKSFLAAFAAFSLLIISPAVQAAGVLDGHPLAYNDGNGPGPGGVWSGSDTYSNGLGTLTGTLEYAVMTNADFDTAFPGAGPASGPPTGLTYDPAGARVYLYQVFNAGTFDVTADIVGLPSPGVDIGQFDDTTIAGDIASSLFGFDSGDKAIWFFATPVIPTGGESYILAYSANFEPTMGTAILVDGGTIGVSEVPVHSGTPIPEPATFALAAFTLLSLGVRRR